MPGQYLDINLSETSMKNRLVKTFEEENNFNNVIVPLTMNIDEVVFIYHHKISEKMIAACKEVLTNYKKINVSFKQIEEKDIDNILDENTLVDVSAAKYLTMALYDRALKRNLDIIYYDEDEEVIKRYNDHIIIAKEIFKLSIKDIIKLGGGQIVNRLHKAVTLEESKQIIYKAVENKDSNYSQFINYVNRIKNYINDFDNKDNTYYLDEKTTCKIKGDSCYQRYKDLDLFKIEDVKLIFKNSEIKNIFSVSGAFLENYVYHKLNDSKQFDEIMMSAKICFNDEQRKYPVTCEIDCIVLKNNRMLFTSIKSNKADVDDLNEIKVHDVMFGNKQTKPVICLHSDMSENKPSVYAKAEELKVYVVDEDSFKENKIVDKFLSIINETYKYDKLR